MDAENGGNQEIMDIILLLYHTSSMACTQFIPVENLVLQLLTGQFLGFLPHRDKLPTDMYLSAVDRLQN